MDEFKIYKFRFLGPVSHRYKSRINSSSSNFLHRPQCKINHVQRLAESLEPRETDPQTFKFQTKIETKAYWTVLHFSSTNSKMVKQNSAVGLFYDMSHEALKQFVCLFL